MLFFVFTLNILKNIKVSIIDSVTYLFKLELKQFKISKILPIWKIDVYEVLIINISINYNATSYFYYKNDIDIYFKSLMA